MNIKFNNWSEITTLGQINDNRSNASFLIGVDLCQNDSDGYSSIDYYCSTCKNIVSTHYIKSKNDAEPIFPMYCPRCNTRFNGWVI